MRETHYSDSDWNRRITYCFCTCYSSLAFSFCVVSFFRALELSNVTLEEKSFAYIYASFIHFSIHSNFGVSNDLNSITVGKCFSIISNSTRLSCPTRSVYFFGAFENESSGWQAIARLSIFNHFFPPVLVLWNSLFKKWSRSWSSRIPTLNKDQHQWKRNYAKPSKGALDCFLFGLSFFNAALFLLPSESRTAVGHR